MDGIRVQRACTLGPCEAAIPLTSFIPLYCGTRQASRMLGNPCRKYKHEILKVGFIASWIRAHPFKRKMVISQRLFNYSVSCGKADRPFVRPCWRAIGEATIPRSSHTTQQKYLQSLPPNITTLQLSWLQRSQESEPHGLYAGGDSHTQTHSIPLLLHELILCHRDRRSRRQRPEYHGGRNLRSPCKPMRRIVAPLQSFDCALHEDG